MRISLAAALCLLASPAAVATGPPKCFPDVVVADALAMHGEIPIFSGHDSKSGNSIVLFANPGGSGWTLMVRQRGMLCPFFSGDTWKIPESIVSDEPT